MKTAIIVVVVVILLGIFGPQTLYTVDETQLVVVTRFGEIQDIHVSPGLYVKLPFVESVNRFDKRVLRVDVPPSTLPDKDKEFLVIDAYARYRITDVKRFFEKLGNLDRAEDRIGRIVISSLREEVAKRDKQEIIGAREEKAIDGETGLEITVVIPTDTRQEILDKVLAASDLGVRSPENDFGVQIIDVRIKRADFPEAAQQNIFSRMRAERDRISREFRAKGQEERDKIEASANRDRAIILANADRQAQITRGEGEAAAIEIVAKALEQGPEFFAFQRSLEAYKKFLSTNTTVVLSSEAELFQFLQSPEVAAIEEPRAIVGPINSISSNLWTVGDHRVHLNGATQITLGQAPETGLVVFVEGAVQEDGGIVASRVVEGLKGILESITVGPGVTPTQEWSVGGAEQVVTVNEDSNIHLGVGQVGLSVLIGFERRDDGSLLALEARIEG